MALDLTCASCHQVELECAEADAADLPEKTIDRICLSVASAVEDKLNKMEARLDVWLSQLMTQQDDVLEKKMNLQQEKEKEMLEEIIAEASHSLMGERGSVASDDTHSTRNTRLFTYAGVAPGMAAPGMAASPSQEPDTPMSQHSKRGFGERPVFGENMSMTMKARSGPNTLIADLHEATNRKNEDMISMGPIQATFTHIVGFTQFDFVFGFMIFLNALAIGAEVEYRTKNSVTHSAFVVTSYIFCTIFTLELIFRLSAAGRRITTGADAKWILFDFGMVIVSFADIVSYLSGFDGQMLRTIRIVRLLRIARVLRFIPQLRMMMFSIVECCRSLFWLSILLLMILYIFSLCFTMGATEYLHKAYGTEDSRVLVDRYYGSVARSLYSCLKAMLVGQGWGELMDPLVDVGEFYATIFLVFTVFSILALLNIVTGVFVNGALEKSENERDMVAEKEVNRRRACVEHLKDIFIETDEDHDGQISYEEFTKHMDDPTVEPYIAAMNIDTSHLEELFQLLDKDNRGQIDFHEFVANLLELMHFSTKGTGRHFHKMIKEQTRMRHKLAKLSAMTDAKLTPILAEVQSKMTMSRQLTSVVRVASNLRPDRPQSLPFGGSRSEKSRLPVVSFSRARSISEL